MSRSYFIKLILAFAILVIGLSNSGRSTEEIARMKDTWYRLTNEECAELEFHSTDCVTYALANIAWRAGPYMFDDAPHLKQDLTFWVYRTDEIDQKFADIASKMKEMQASIDRDRKVMDETSKMILLRFERFPTNLPADNNFYQQMLTRLKADIRADQKANSALTPQ